MSTIVSSAAQASVVPSQSKTAVPFSNTAAPRPSLRMRALHVDIPSTNTIARAAIPTVMGTHRQVASAHPSADLLSSPMSTCTLGHGHPACADDSHSPLMSAHPSASARASRRRGSSWFSAAAIMDDAGAYAAVAAVGMGLVPEPRPTEDENEELSHAEHGADEDQHSRSASIDSSSPAEFPVNESESA